MRAPRYVRRVIPLALGATVLTGTGLAWAHSGDAGPGYRTATVAVGDVTQVVTATGTVTGLDTAAAAFGVVGLVDEVEVEAGDTVKAGEVLVRMDTAALDAALTSAEATLAKAKADLEDAENALAAADDTSEQADTEASDEDSGSPQVGGRQGGGSTPTPGGEVDLTAPTRALNEARTAATVALGAATTALTAQQVACADVVAPAPEQPANTEEIEATEETEPADRTEALRACVDALAAVAAAQDRVATAQAAVTTAETAYRAAMDQALAAAKARATASEEATELAQAAAAAARKQLSALALSQQSSSQTPSRSTGGGGTSTLDLNAKVTVETAAVRVAQAELEGAQEDRDAAVLRAPISGTVGEVPFTEGKTASADDAISILGDGAMQVELAVPSATASKLTKGMTAAVTSDGADGPSDATVSAIGILPSSTTGTTTYPVMITVPQPSKGLAEGAAAAVTITLRSAQGVTTVPNSTLSATGIGATAGVTLLQDGKPVRKNVTTGAVGNTTTEIIDGLTEGQVIVLADPSAEVPTSSTSATRSGATGFGGGGFGGAGAGGFAGGGATVTRGR